MGSKALQAGNQFVQNIVSTLSSLPGRMLSIGANIVNGIVSGIQSKIGSIASSLLSGVNDAISSMSLDSADWSKTGRLNVTTATPSSMNGGVVQNFNVKVVRADSDLAAASTILTRNALHAARGI